jgi:hypothetical protein
MTDINLAPIPTGWQTSTNGGMSLGVGGANGANISFDDANQYNGVKSVKIASGNLVKNPARECDGPWLHAKPGDHVRFITAVKTSPSTLGESNNPQAGGRIGVDIYDNQGYVAGLNNSKGGETCSDIDNTYVKWGTATWTIRTIEFVVAAMYAGKVPTGIIPWKQVWSDVKGAADGGTAWFGGTTVVINPTDSPVTVTTPMPVTTLTPTVTPTGPTQAQYDTLKTQLDNAVSSNTTLQTAQTTLKNKIAAAIQSLQT